MDEEGYASDPIFKQGIESHMSLLSWDLRDRDCLKEVFV